jgi:hypothetical protein
MIYLFIHHRQQFAYASGIALVMLQWSYVLVWQFPHGIVYFMDNVGFREKQ